MKLYLIRHGQTVWNVEGKVQGSTDIPLDETGIMQAGLVAAGLKPCQVKRVYCSRQKRAVQTAQIIGEGLAAEVIPTEGLHEVGFGLWEGLTWEAIGKTYPQTYEKWKKNPSKTVPEGGESLESVFSRCSAAMNRILENETEDAAIVAHGAILSHIITYLLKDNLPKQEIIVDNSSITTLEYNPETLCMAILELNSTRHLNPGAC